MTLLFVTWRVWKLKADASWSRLIAQQKLFNENVVDVVSAAGSDAGGVCCCSHVKTAMDSVHEHNWTQSNKVTAMLLVQGWEQKNKYLNSTYV